MVNLREILSLRTHDNTFTTHTKIDERESHSIDRGKLTSDLTVRCC